MYSYRIEQAIRAAAVLHQDQKRKGDAGLPYIIHLMAVVLILRDYTEDEDTLIGALLHDTIEDTDYTVDELREDFGEKIEKIVVSLSEPPRDEGHTWKERKAAYAQKLRSAPEEALLIAAADKIHNMRCIVEDYYDASDRFVRDFGGSLDDRAMMYQDISNVLNNRLKSDIIAEFNHVYTEYKNFVLNVKKHQEEK